MKLLITSQGPELDSPVDPRFGRAGHIILFDTETGQHTSHPNTQNLNAVQGAGIQTAQNAADLGAQAVLTGHCGPKAFRALQTAGIPIYTDAQGSVRQTIDRFLAGQWQPTQTADVEGHWA